MNVDRILASTSDDDLEDEEDARAALEAILQEEESDEDDMFLTKGAANGFGTSGGSDHSREDRADAGEKEAERQWRAREPTDEVLRSLLAESSAAPGPAPAPASAQETSYDRASHNAGSGGGGHYFDADDDEDEDAELDAILAEYKASRTAPEPEPAPAEASTSHKAAPEGEDQRMSQLMREVDEETAEAPSPGPTPGLAVDNGANQAGMLSQTELAGTGPAPHAEAEAAAAAARPRDDPLRAALAHELSLRTAYTDTAVSPLRAPQRPAEAHGVGQGGADALRIDTLGEVTSQLEHNARHRRHGPGFPTCLAVRSKLLALGTSRGLVLLFDHFQKQRATLGTAADGESTGAVTALALSADLAHACAGYRDGRIILWDAVSASALKVVTDAHASPVVAVRVYTDASTGRGAPSVLSADNSGVVSLTTFSKMLWWTADTQCVVRGDAGQVQALAVQPPAPRGVSRSGGLATEGGGGDGKPLPGASAGLVALSLPTVTFVLALRPKARLLFRWARPGTGPRRGGGGDSEERLRELARQAEGGPPCLSWGWSFVRDSQRTPALVLARAWGRCIQLLLPVFGGSGAEGHLPRGYKLVGESVARAPVAALQWLTPTAYAYATQERELVVVDAAREAVLARTDLSAMSLVHVTFAAPAAGGKEEEKEDKGVVEGAGSAEGGLEASEEGGEEEDEAPASSAPEQPAAASLHSLMNSFKVSGGGLYLLGHRTLCLARLQSWLEQVQVLTDRGDWIQALARALAHYHAELHRAREQAVQAARSAVKAARRKAEEMGGKKAPESTAAAAEAEEAEVAQEAGVPSAASKAGGEALAAAAAEEVEVDEGLVEETLEGMPSLRRLTQQLRELLHSYVELACRPEESGARGSAVTTLARLCVEFCLEVRGLWRDLMGPVFERFCTAGHEAALLEQLEAPLLSGRLRELSPEVTQRLAEHYRSRGWLDRLERCLLRIDPWRADLDGLVRLCRAHGLRSALVHVLTRGVRDFAGPLPALADACLEVIAAEVEREGAPGGGGESAARPPVGACWAVQRPAELDKARYRLLLFLRQGCRGRAFPRGLLRDTALTADEAREQVVEKMFAQRLPQYAGPAFPLLSIVLRLDAVEACKALAPAFSLPCPYADEAQAKRESDGEGGGKEGTRGDAGSGEEEEEGEEGDEDEDEDALAPQWWVPQSALDPWSTSAAAAERTERLLDASLPQPPRPGAAAAGAAARLAALEHVVLGREGEVGTVLGANLPPASQEAPAGGQQQRTRRVEVRLPALSAAQRAAAMMLVSRVLVWLQRLAMAAAASGEAPVEPPRTGRLVRSAVLFLSSGVQAATAPASAAAAQAAAAIAPRSEREELLVEVVKWLPLHNSSSSGGGGGNGSSDADGFVDGDELLSAVQRAGMPRVEAELRAREGDVEGALAAYLRDDHPARLGVPFAYLVSEAARGQRREAVQRAVLGAVAQLAARDRDATAQLVARLFDGDHGHVLKALAVDPALQFRYLHGVMTEAEGAEEEEEEEQDEGEDKREVDHEVTPDMRALYVDLLCREHPHRVLPYLRSRATYPLDACLRACRQHGVVDASAYLLERTGSVREALATLLAEISRRIDRLTYACGLWDVLPHAGDDSPAPTPTPPPSLSPSSSSHGEAIGGARAVAPAEAGVRSLLRGALALCARHTRAGYGHGARTAGPAEELPRPLQRRRGAPAGAAAESEGGADVAAAPGAPRVDEEAEAMWFAVLDCVAVPQRRVKRAARGATGSGRVAEGLRAADAALGRLLLRTLDAMRPHVRLSRVLDKVLEEHGSDELGEFRGTLASVLGAYVQEVRMMESMSSLLHNDVDAAYRGARDAMSRPIRAVVQSQQRQAPRSGEDGWRGVRAPAQAKVGPASALTPRAHRRRGMQVASTADAGAAAAAAAGEADAARARLAATTPVRGAGSGAGGSAAKEPSRDTSTQLCLLRLRQARRKERAAALWSKQLA